MRSSAKGATIAAAFPKTRIVYGELNDLDLIKTESSNADIFLSALFRSSASPQPQLAPTLQAAPMPTTRPASAPWSQASPHAPRWPPNS